MGKFEEIDLSRVKTYKANTRKSKVNTDVSGVPPFSGITMKAFLDGLPKVLKAGELLEVAKSVVHAREKGKPVIVMIGGHVAKTGCCPILADLVTKGYLTHIASNGAAAIHDTELARFGQTSEDVPTQLEDGSFGMAKDTCDLVNQASVRAANKGEGFGEAVGAMLVEEEAPYIDKTLIAKCYQSDIPYTLHVAIGTDIVHQHPSADGAAIGDASHRDFRIFCSTVSKLGEGGVVLNFGSAVVMPEVFLKAIAVARNLSNNVKNFTTANFDMIQHYRPMTNVVERPVLSGGKGFSITGHHEIMIPLFAAAVFEASV